MVSVPQQQERMLTDQEIRPSNICGRFNQRVGELDLHHSIYMCE
jgi:hypothetical protein